MSLLLSYTAIILLVAESSQAYPSRGHCHPVPSFCRNLTNGDSYTKMRLPNAFNNNHLNETVAAIRPWEPLVGLGCHAELKLFLCAIYAPICLEQKEPSDFEVTIKICRSFCSSVKTSCEPVMERHSHSWPRHDAFNCSHYVDNGMCVQENAAATAKPPTTSASNVICDPSLNPDDVLIDKEACSSALVVRAEVTDIRVAKGDSSYFLLKIKVLTVRKPRKTKKASDNPNRVFLPQAGCRNFNSLMEGKNNNSYFIFLDKRSGKKTKYDVKAIVLWKAKRYKEIKNKSCEGR